MGKTLEEAKGEVKKSAMHCRYYAGKMEEFLEPKKLNLEGAQ